MLYDVRTVLAEDPEANLIRVSTGVPSRSIQPPEFNLSLPQVGERLVVLPNPWGVNRPVAPARVSALVEVPVFGTLIRLTMVLSPGYNGSLLVNGRDQIVGVLTLADSENFNVIPMERVARLIAGPGRTLKDWEAKRNDAAERSYSEALWYQQRGDYEKALLSLKQAVAKNPRYTEAHFQMGYCYSQLRRNEEAVEAYREALRLKPDFVLAHFYLGLAYLDLKDKDGARREYEALKPLDKDYARDLLDLI